MNKRIKNVFCILLVAMMLVAHYSYAAGEQAAETDTPILLLINEDMLDVWAEKLGFSKSLKNLFNAKAMMTILTRFRIISRIFSPVMVQH